MEIVMARMRAYIHECKWGFTQRHGGRLSEIVLGHRLEEDSGSSISDIWFGEMLEGENGKRCLHEFLIWLLSNDSKLGEAKKSELEVWLSDRVLS